MLRRPDVNVEAIMELADFLESEKYIFNMREPFIDPECGHAGCIGGHAAVLWPELCDAESYEDRASWDDEALAHQLGITEEQCKELCYMHSFARRLSIFDAPGWVGLYQRVTRGAAVAVLRRLAATGRVEWDAVLADRQ